MFTWRFKRKSSKNWKDEIVRKNSVNKNFTKVNGTIMFPSSHDIHPIHLNESILVLKKLLNFDNKILIVSKPHYLCIKKICTQFKNYKKNILFRFTIGSTSSKILKFWEPGAPSFSERFRSLKFAYNNGFQTSISCEPMLDNNVEDLIEKVSPFVTDSIWVGKVNFLLRRLKINNVLNQITYQKAFELLEWQSNENIIKLYMAFKDNPKIKWKESIKNIVGISIPKEKGLDI